MSIGGTLYHRIEELTRRVHGARKDLTKAKEERRTYLFTAPLPGNKTGTWCRQVRRYRAPLVVRAAWRDPRHGELEVPLEIRRQFASDLLVPNHNRRSGDAYMES